jgi:hypothetical protein
MATAPQIRRVGCDPATTQLESQAEIASYLPREKAYQIGISRKACIKIREDLLGNGSAAQEIVFLENQDTKSGAGQVAGGDQAVMTCAQDDGVVAIVLSHLTSDRKPLMWYKI